MGDLLFNAFMFLIMAIIFGATSAIVGFEGAVFGMLAMILFNVMRKD